MSGPSRKEFELLRVFSRSRLSEEELKRGAKILESGIDWQTFFRAAFYHSLLPLAARHIKDLGYPNVSDENRKYLEEWTKSYTLKSKFIVGEIARLADYFDDHKIPFVFVKGSVLAQAAYGDHALRQYGDIDVIIRSGDLEIVEQALAELDYEMHSIRSDLSRWNRYWNMFFGSQVPYVRGNQIFHLDLHTHIMPLHFKFRPDADELLRRSIDVAFGGRTVKFPVPEVTLQILCFHGHKNRWETIKYICDISELIRAFPNLNWDEVVAEAKAKDGYPILLTGLNLAHKFLDAPIPQALIQRIADDKRVTALSQSVLGRLPEQHVTGTIPLNERIRLQHSTLGSVKGMLRYIGIAALSRLLVWK